MNEKGSWRARLNAIEVFKQMLNRAPDWDMNLAEYAGFVVAMGLDHVYAVRQAAFSTLPLFPSGEELSCVVDPLFSLTERQMSDLQVTIIRHLLTDGKEVILKNYKAPRLAPILKRVNLDEAAYYAKPR
jgi:hypothetical protein